MVVNNNYFNNINIGRISEGQKLPEKQKVQKPEGSFEQVLRDRIQENTGLKFSKHAELRLQARNITLNNSQKQKINEAVKKAEEKGVKDSLVLMDDIALVVNVKSKTVITAASSKDLKENVFTNIDGAVIV